MNPQAPRAGVSRFTVGPNLLLDDPRLALRIRPASTTAESSGSAIPLSDGSARPGCRVNTSESPLGRNGPPELQVQWEGGRPQVVRHLRQLQDRNEQARDVRQVRSPRAPDFGVRQLRTEGRARHSIADPRGRGAPVRPMDEVPKIRPIAGPSARLIRFAAIGITLNSEDWMIRLPVSEPNKRKDDVKTLVLRSTAFSLGNLA